MQDNLPETRFEAAFHYVERAKARVLVEMIARDVEQIANTVGNDRLRELFLEIVRAGQEEEAARRQGEPQLGLTDPSPDAVRTAAQRADAARGRRLQRQEELLAQHPELLSLVTVHALSLRAVREQVLTDDDVLLEYYQLDDNTFLAFVVDKAHGILATERISLVDPDSETGQQIDDLAGWIQKNCLPLSVGSNVSPFGSPARFAKADRLFLPEPIRNALHLGKEHESLRKKRLIVVAHGLLHRLAFHALTPDGQRFLIDEFEKGIVYAPSATALSYCQKKEKRGVARSALILANPTGDLRYAQVEGDLLWHRYGPHGCFFYGPSATPQALSDWAGQVDALIILSHGLHVEESMGDPLSSHIKLAGDDVSIRALYALPAPATLHDYGFCFGATVTPRAGDEFVSITRGGFCSGARSILAALWAVPNDKSTVFLKTTFHKRWHECCDKGLALKQAMEETRRQWSDLLYWAPFILTGDWQ